MSQNDMKAMFGTDQELETNGAWIELMPGTKFLIARASTPRYHKALRAAYAPYEIMVRGSVELDPDLDAKLNVKVIAKSILLGWEGVSFNGQEIEYSYDNCILILTELPDLRAWVWDQANRVSNYRNKTMVELGKD